MPPKKPGVATSTTLTTQRTWKCDRCSQPIEKQDVVGGAARIVDGKQLICARCLKQTETRKSASRTPALMGLAAAILLLGLGILVPRYLMLLTAAGCGLAVLVAILAPALSVRERTLGICGSIVFGLLCVMGLRIIGRGDGPGDERRALEAAVAQVQASLAKNEPIEAHRHALNAAALAAGQPALQDNPAVKSALEAAQEALEKWFERDYGQTSPRERDGLIQLFKAFGIKDDSGAARFRGLRLQDQTLILTLPARAEQADGLKKAAAAAKAAADKEGAVLAAFLFNFYNHPQRVEVRWVPGEGGADAEPVHVLHVTPQDLRMQPPQGPPPRKPQEPGPDMRPEQQPSP